MFCSQLYTNLASIPWTIMTPVGVCVCVCVCVVCVYVCVYLCLRPFTVKASSVWISWNAWEQINDFML